MIGRECRQSPIAILSISNLSVTLIVSIQPNIADYAEHAVPGPMHRLCAVDLAFGKSFAWLGEATPAVFEDTLVKFAVVQLEMP